MSFDSLGLSAALLRDVQEQGYSAPTPIQARVIPVVLAGRDVLAGAQTGTGKTAGFTLPLLQRLSASAPNEGRRRIRALILTPTRELAAQVEDSVRRYGKYVPLRSAVVFGGVNINPQISQLRRGIDVLVATPGRLLDHASQRNVDLSISKSQKIGGTTLSVRADVLNLFDNPLFTNLGTQLGTATFGQLTAVGGYARSTQFQVRLGW